MSVLKDIVQPQCGQSNALVDLANKIFPSEGTKQQPKPPLFREKIQNDFVDEFLVESGSTKVVPATFNMQSLLEQINVNKSNPFLGHFPAERFTKTNVPVDDWLKEFDLSQNVNDSVNRWEIPMNEAYLSKAWANVSDDTLDHSSLKWSVEYLLEAEKSPTYAKDHIRSKPNRDPGLDWIKAFEEFSLSNCSSEQMPNRSTVSATSDVQGEDVERVLNEGWGDANDEVNKWVEEYTRVFESQKLENCAYEFKNDNPYKYASDPFSQGKGFLEMGDLANAVLCFEAAAQQQPDNAEAWQYLGQAQAENEYEMKTIAALHQCLKLQPNNLQALLLLSIAYTNESLYDSGCRTLLEWLKVNPRYASFVQNSLSQTILPSTSFLNRDLFTEVESAFLRAINKNTANFDPDLQNALGILYNMSGDLQKAVDCFRTALVVKPDHSLNVRLRSFYVSGQFVSEHFKDARLWNRLGATLANDHLFFSITQAMDHFISALTLQQSGIGPSNEADMSQTIWNTLRVAACCLTRSDSGQIINLIDEKNFEALKNTFTTSAINLSPNSRLFV